MDKIECTDESNSDLQSYKNKLKAIHAANCSSNENTRMKHISQTIKDQIIGSTRYDPIDLTEDGTGLLNPIDLTSDVEMADSMRTHGMVIKGKVMKPNPEIETIKFGDCTIKSLEQVPIAQMPRLEPISNEITDKEFYATDSENEFIGDMKPRLDREQRYKLDLLNSSDSENEIIAHMKSQNRIQIEDELKYPETESIKSGIRMDFNQINDETTSEPVFEPRIESISQTTSFMEDMKPIQNYESESVKPNESIRKARKMQKMTESFRIPTIQEHNVQPLMFDISIPGGSKSYNDRNKRISDENTRTSELIKSCNTSVKPKLKRTSQSLFCRNESLQPITQGQIQNSKRASRSGISQMTKRSEEIFQISHKEPSISTKTKFGIMKPIFGSKPKVIKPNLQKEPMIETTPVLTEDTEIIDMDKSSDSNGYGDFANVMITDSEMKINL